jgi:Phasin protein
MGKPQSRQPADAARARRRSLVELTAALSHAIDESMLEMPTNPVAVSRDDGPRGEQAVKTPPKTSPQKTSPQKTPPRETFAQEVSSQRAPAETAVPAAVNGSVAGPESAKAASRSAETQITNGAADFAAEIAKDMQARAIEAMKIGAHAALGYTKDFASTENNHLEDTAAAEYHAIVLELMKVNAGATFQYTRELSSARTLSEWVELSSSHARRQCELVLEQARLLKSLARNATRSGAE